MSLGIGLVESFSEFKEFKNIDRATMIRVMEDVFRSMLKRRYGDDSNFDVIVNDKTGDVEIYQRRLIVDEGEVENDITEISLSEARKIEPDFELNEETYEEITMEAFGRRSILAARQTLISRILELEKDEVYKKYRDREGEIINGEVYQIWKKELMVLDDEGNELILPKSEMIPRDFYKKGDSLKAVVLKVEMNNALPRIILSRTAPIFLERLFELEVPEILDGLITIKKVVREPGERAKVAVESYDDRIDPVGACVGMKGSRIHGIVRELRNENIDVINYTTNTQLFLARALNPAKISSIAIDENTKRVAVYLPSDQVSLAIGKGGYNIKLAGKLVGYEIDVYREDSEDEYDVDLEEFNDEIDDWILEELKAIGLDTAKSVLAVSNEDLVRRTELEEETVVEIKKILEAEFT
jgi:N utilization substance protein A